MEEERVTTRPSDGQPERVIAALRALLEQLEEGDTAATPWIGSADVPLSPGRISATDQLSWWFRPAAGAGEDPWERFFTPPGTTPLAAGPPRAREMQASPPDGHHPWAAAPAAATAPPGRRVSLQLLLAEPEEEMIDADAEAVVAGLYDFVHALGRRDVDAAMTCVAADFHALDEGREIDRSTLARQLRALLDPFIGWDLTTSLVEIPQPMLHPDAILVHAELQLEAHHPATGEWQSVVEPRIAVFRQQRDRRWLISGLAPI
jgi:ketosteroid isomerase-like protein